MNQTQNRTYKFLLIGLFCLLQSLAPPLRAQGISYKAQSLYIYIFAKNITWPQGVASKEFNISVYGNSPILEELKVMASLKKTPQGQTIRVKNLLTVEEIGNEQIVYIPSSKSRELKRIVEQVGDAATLLVAEREGLARKGAGINFIVMENNSLKFEVNPTVLTKQRLKISTQLLEKGFEVD